MWFGIGVVVVVVGFIGVKIVFFLKEVEFEYIMYIIIEMVLLKLDG